MVFSILQKDLVHQFNTTATARLVRAEELVIQRRYLLFSITKVFTTCEQLLLLRLQSDVDDDVIQAYLPSHYLDVFSDSIITNINSGRTTYYMVSNGIFPNSETLLLTLEL
jgi:hypothetical protein